MSDRPKEFNRAANPNAHHKVGHPARPIASKAELQKLEAQRDVQALRFNPPAPPGMALTGADYRRAALNLEGRIAYTRQRLGRAQENMRRDFHEATGTQRPREQARTPYQKRMLLRREFNRQARDQVKDRER